MGVNGFGFPLSPAPSPVPSIRRLRIRSPRLDSAIDDRENDIVEAFRGLDSDAKSRVLKQLLSVAPRDTLLDAQSVIQPRLRHDPFKALPLEVSLKILSYIRDPQSLAAAAQVSRLWYFLLSDDSTWKQLCQDHHFRRLSAAGSYVHRWNTFRERASSHAIEETPEAEEYPQSQWREDNQPQQPQQPQQLLQPQQQQQHTHHSMRRRGRIFQPIAEGCERDNTENVSPSTREDRQSGLPERSSEETSQDANQDASHDVNEHMVIYSNPFSQSQTDNGTEAPPYEEDLRAPSEVESHEDATASESESQTETQNEDEEGEDEEDEEEEGEDQEEEEHDQEQLQQRELENHLARHPPPQMGPLRGNDPRRNSLLGNQQDIQQIRRGVANGELLMQYGSRLPNFDSEMQQHLTNTADPSGDPIGEAYFDPQVSITSPPDSYRSHFRQQYLINQAWAHGGRLAARYSLPDHEGAIVTTVLMQDGFIVVALDTSLILVFSDDGKLLRSLYGHVMGVWALALKGHTLLSGGCDRDVREWDLNTGACRKILRGHSSTVRCLAMATPHIALSGGRDAVIRVWDLKDGKSLYRLVGHVGSVRRLEVTTVDGTMYAVSASYDCTAKIWNIENGTLVHTLAGHTNQIYSLAVDKGRIATGSLDHTICVWDLRTGAKLGTLLGHSALVGQLCLRDDVLVSGGSDGAVRIWDLNQMVCVHRIAAHDNTVTCLRLTEDRIITGGPDCRVQMWNVRTGKHIRQLYKETVSTVWGVAAKEDRLLTVYSEGASIVIELMSFAPA